MFCKQCQTEGKSSKVKILNIEGDPKYYAYFDEKGVYHDHTFETFNQKYECTNGHLFELEFRERCGECACEEFEEFNDHKEEVNV